MLHRTHNNLDLNPGRGTAPLSKNCSAGQHCRQNPDTSSNGIHVLCVRTVADHASPWISKQVNTLLPSVPHIWLNNPLNGHNHIAVSS